MASRRQIKHLAAAGLEKESHGASAGESIRERQLQESILQMMETIARLEDDIKAVNAANEALRQENDELRRGSLMKDARLYTMTDALKRANEQRARLMQMMADDSEAGTETGSCGTQ